MTQLHKRSLSGAVTVSGDEYCWSVHREPQWCTADGWKGLSIAVEIKKEPGRQLLIEYPFKVSGKSLSQTQLMRPPVSAQDIAIRISQALAEGWSPHSRGKPFAFQVPA